MCPDIVKVAVITLGCSKNSVDAENMLALIKSDGCDLTADMEKADVIIINTCCFVNDAKEESVNAILEAAQYKINGKCKRLIVAGCLAQRYKEEIIKEIPEVDFVIGVGHIKDITTAVRGNCASIMCADKYSHPKTPRLRQTPLESAYLKIADGCDNKCTYCIIPYIRGGFLSKPIETLLDEARLYASEGVKELLLIAQDSTKYGVDLYGKPRLVQLLSQLCKIDGIEWIRLHYCYPEGITDELIDIIAKEDKICKYFDIPVQHCNDEVLRRMGRKTSKAQIKNVILKIRKKIPQATLRTTLITGFPGETDEHYIEMLEFIKEMKFERLGVFTYSREEGTPAARLKYQISDKVKRQRQKRLMLAQKVVSQTISNNKIGKKIRVLTQGYDFKKCRYYGRSEADSPDIDGMVYYTSEKRLKPGDFVSVIIQKATNYDLLGEENDDNGK